ncbi:MAG: hypothetical protein ABI054_12580, partial [Planctomycetota bacterium]
IGPGKLTPDAIQSEIMSFADTYSSVIAQRWNEAGSRRSDPAAEDPEVAVNNARARRSAHERKLASVSAAISIAANPNPLVSVADMLTLVTLERGLLEDPSTAELFGEEAAAKLLATYKDEEAALWRIAARAYTQKQQDELRELIEAWRQAHPDQRYVSQVRLEDFAVARQQVVATKPESGSLLSLVMLDPLAGLDPTKREVRESRMLAARAFYQLTRMPTILKWQAESFYMGFLQAPEIKSAMESVSQVSEAADRVSKAAEQLPVNFAAERKEAIDQLFAGIAEQRTAIVKDLDQGQDKLQVTLKDFRETVEATDKLSASLKTTAAAIGSVAERLMPPPGEASAQPESHKLAEFQAAAAETGAAADRLTVLAGKVEQLLDPKSLDQRTAALQTAVGDARQSAKDVIDFAFWRLLILILVLPVAIMLAIASYRWLTRRSRDLSLDRPQRV